MTEDNALLRLVGLFLKRLLFFFQNIHIRITKFSVRGLVFGGSVHVT
jgi:hypothetical protein